MSETNQRLNKLVTTALNTSPHSRDAHDTYYKNKKYKYATTADNPLAAYVSYNNTSDRHMRIVLAMNRSDNLLIAAVHHELTHVKQIWLADEQNIPATSPYLRLNDRIAKTLLWEAHAHTMHIEGPLFGFFKDIENGDMKNLQFYKEHFSTPEIKQDAENYIKALVNGKIDFDKFNDFVDMAGYVYLNVYQRLDDEEKKKMLTNARKASIENFFDREDDGNASRLDSYIKRGIEEQKLFNVPIQDIEQIYEQNKKGMLYGGKRMNNVLPMQAIFKTMHGERQELFLSETDWYEALKTDTNDKLVMGVIYRSIYMHLYHEAAPQTITGNSNQRKYDI